MRYLDMDKWNRKQHFEHFSNISFPQFNVCSNVDVSNYKRYIKEQNIPFFISMLYLVTRAANEIKEFRYRIRDGKVIEHHEVSPSYTVMGKDEVFGFGMSDYHSDFNTFRKRAETDIKFKSENISLEFDPEADHYLYITSLPWVTFTSISHPIHLDPVGSVPMIGWGKYFNEGDRIKMPFSIQAHHALVDGYHVGKFMMLLQEMLDEPEKYLK